MIGVFRCKSKDYFKLSLIFVDVGKLDTNLGDALNYFHNCMSGYFGFSLCTLHNGRCG